MLPLWTGAIPSGIAYGVAAHEAGIASGETVLMSLIVFSAAGQLSAVALIDEGAQWPLLLATVLALNVQLLLLGLAVGRLLRLSRGQRFWTAWFLTDAAFAIAAGRGPLRGLVLLGAGVSMYLGWNLGTWLGIVAGGALRDPQALGVGLVVPLSFLAVLVPLLRSRPMVAAAVAAAGVTLPLAAFLPSGVAVLAGGVVGCAFGAGWARRTPPRTETP
jgi:predicted branched-subunit amino acid permease